MNDYLDSQKENGGFVPAKIIASRRLLDVKVSLSREEIDKYLKKL